MCCTMLCCGPRTGPIRMLVAHADESYEEWGYSGSLVYEPGTHFRLASERAAAAARVARSSGDYPASGTR